MHPVRVAKTWQKATLIDTNLPFEIEMFGSKMYVCVAIRGGTSEFVFEISEMTAALGLFVGYPDLATLEGGGDQFWASERGGRENELIRIEPGADGFVDPGT